jgi:hypothetical protein
MLINGKEWKLVPVEPTREMIGAGWERVTRELADGHTSELNRLWSAMLAATPTSPSADEDDGYHDARYDFAGEPRPVPSATPGIETHFLKPADGAGVGDGGEVEAVEAAARAMCDRVNGIGDYDANIDKRRAGWLSQARAGVKAYLAALRSSSDQPGGERGAIVIRDAKRVSDWLANAGMPDDLTVRDAIYTLVRALLPGSGER